MLRRVLIVIRKFLALCREQGFWQALRVSVDVAHRRFLPLPSQTLPDPEPPSITDFRISILMPVYNTPPDVLDEAICSVIEQTYPNWELCICDDCSTSKATLQVLERYRGIDPRIKILRSPSNAHIARATNMAADVATGHFVGFLDHDDTLSPDALASVVRAIEDNPNVDVLYTDEDKIEPGGSFSEPYLKPDWSPEHLQSVMYLLHFLVVRKALFLRLGGLRHEYTGAQDYDLALRATAQARKVVHVPRVLYHWRKVTGSAAAIVDAKPEALLNGQRAISDFVRCIDPAATVDDGLLQGTFRVKWPVQGDRPVTLLILTGGRSREIEGRGNVFLVENTIRSIVEKTSFPNYQLLVIENGRMPPAQVEKLKELGARVVSFNAEPQFNFPNMLNFGLAQVATDDVIILNDDLEVISADWIEALLSHSRRSEIGAVGARLLYPNDRNQHVGIVLGVDGISTHIFHNLERETVGYQGYTHLVRNYSAVTAAVMATRMEVIREVGMFDPTLRVDYNDIDFCLRVGAAGYRIVYTPHAMLYHFERSSLQRTVADSADRQVFEQRWFRKIASDPFYNPNLPRNRTDCFVARW
jgi:O-antigen biosynthesis protein